MSRIVFCSLAGLILAAAVEREAQAGRLAMARRARAAAAQDALAADAAALERRSVMAPGAACCPPPTIVYRHRGPRPCSPCAATVPAVLTVVNPCTCCPVEIPLCLPACCTGTPVVGSRQGMLASCVVTYDWCCGVHVAIRFKPCGEVVVVTRGV